MIKSIDLLLTTKDNPFNPFTQYDDWKYFDEISHHYDTESYVARETGMLDFDLSEEALADERLRAFNEIIRLNNEMGIDIYTLIDRDGNKLDDSPSTFLNDTPGVSEEEPTPV